MRFSKILVTLMAALLLLAAHRAEPEHHVTLEMRQDNGPYKHAAYNFREASGDTAVHRNYVDLLLNKCGMLHINPVTGQANRICDLGALTLKASPDAAPADAKWNTECIKPEQGHVYLEEIDGQGQTMTVKFVVDEVDDGTVKLTWQTVKPLVGPKPAPSRGVAGTMGQCGGAHDAN
ncbi:hypothetical protein BH09PLA1_BH09PLA1_03550 [soil metagenome]